MLRILTSFREEEKREGTLKLPVFITQAEHI